MLFTQCLFKIYLSVHFISFVFHSRTLADIQNNTEWMSIKRLRSKLLNNYDKQVDPVQRQGNNTVVNLTLSIIYSMDLIEKNETLILEGSIRRIWQDDRMIWNPDEFGGLDSLPVYEEDIWLPKITILESAPDQSHIQLRTRPVIKALGTIYWSVRGTFKSLCPLTFDIYLQTVQTCNISFLARTPEDLNIDLRIGSPKIHGDGPKSISTKWKFVGYEVKRIVRYEENVSRNRIYVVYSFKIQSMPPKEIKIVKLPIIVSIILMLLMFWLPSSNDKKLTLGATSIFILLSLFFYVVNIVESPISKNIAIYPIRSMVYIVVSAILFEILVLLVTRLRTEPPKLTDILYGNVGRVMCLFCRHDTRDEPKAKRSPEEVWKMVAKAMDRFLFISFVIVVVVVRLC
ncbi:neuronal acetylcholine receptor subunit non-alpha-3-like [Centruroides vittatus]|uniref:neuronal acetylcholine receptor subunit non-alpha-3-like n=1 Tax=Centruroides vittatus TaxID=120091 RepID=UPI00350F3D46